ncbi:methylmalonyl-CoA mutase subunit beta [Gilvibacter sediminis]|uniref:methylmalonyl-CoA mutase subunit beta n=1 Tax=Gilvibacter sediminis TaxID=379071 RepID=UPI00234FBC18|nr:methylmalonyl-CoA mutase subunit beta [Gilvibacter sediminis]MDC7998928.1 methylmalonyl-CoA mutase subunit beta [Gilvibacter sediminis]
MSDNLFEQFEGVSAKQWKQSIQAGLRGADYNETLLTSTPEGITIKPFYNAETTPETLSGLNYPENWSVTQAVFVHDTRVARGLILKSIQGGAEAILLEAASSFDPEALFEGLDLNGISLYCDFTHWDAEFLTKFSKAASTTRAHVHLGVDIIGNLVKTGNWIASNESDHHLMEAAVKAHANSGLSVSVNHYGNAGANAVQELAYALAHTNEYLNHLEQAGKLEQDLAINYRWSIGANYFMEIAKFRAFRRLIKELGALYNIQLNDTHLARPSSRNKTIYDPNVNMLRTTTECMSAVLGGVDAVCNLPYDAVYHKSNEFGERISRNQLLILKNESYFDQVTNAADGAYYIEDLSQQLAQKALELFKQLEASGGFVKALFAGTIQRKIREQAKEAQAAFDSGKKALLGTNLYPNEEEKVSQTVELYPFLKQESRKTIIEPLIIKRIAESHEKNRLDHE